MAADGYTRTQIVLHWLVVLLVAAEFLLPDGMKRASVVVENGEDGKVPQLTGEVLVHFGLGAAILLLVALLLMQRAERAPAPDGALIVTALYAVLILQPVTGAIARAVGSTRIAALHELLGWLLLALIALHLAAVLHGQFILRNGALSRMWRPRDRR